MSHARQQQISIPAHMYTHTHAQEADHTAEQTPRDGSWSVDIPGHTRPSRWASSRVMSAPRRTSQIAPALYAAASSASLIQPARDAPYHTSTPVAAPEEGEQHSNTTDLGAAERIQLIATRVTPTLIFPESAQLLRPRYVRVLNDTWQTSAVAGVCPLTRWCGFTSERVWRLYTSASNQRFIQTYSLFGTCGYLLSMLALAGVLPEAYLACNVVMLPLLAHWCMFINLILLKQLMRRFEIWYTQQQAHNKHTERTHRTSTHTLRAACRWLAACLMCLSCVCVV